MSDMHEQFNSKLVSIMNTKRGNCGFLTKQKYDELLKKVKISKCKINGKKPDDYQRLKRYDIIKVGNTERLILPVKGNANIRLYVYFEELFSIIHETHLAINHGGRNKMVKELQIKYKNITTEEIMVYINLCEHCQKKSRVVKKQPMVQSLTRCHVELIDMQSQPDNDFKFILIYQDYLTKFVQLRPIKCVEDVTHNLIDIFTIFEAPDILESNNDQLNNQIVIEACAMWPDLKIMTQTQSNRQDIENIFLMLRAWLESKRTRKWSEGLRFLQLMMNRTVHEGINCAPYDAMFRTPVKVDLMSIRNDSEHQTEEELQENEIDDSDDYNDPSQNHPPLQVNWQEQDTSTSQIKIEPTPEDSHSPVWKNEDFETFYTNTSPEIKEEPALEDMSQSVRNNEDVETFNTFNTESNFEIKQEPLDLDDHNDPTRDDQR